MSDATPSADSLEHRLGIVARGVQRMADSFGALEQRLADLADGQRLQALSDRTDEYRVRSRSEVAQLAERLERLESEHAQAVELLQSIERVVTEQQVPLADDRFTAIETVLAALRDELAIDRLESSLRGVAEDTSGLRADVRRSFDRVLHEISTSEESLKGEVRAIDQRLTGFGDDLRLVRGLRDGLEALASGVDAVRQLASRSATSNQMGELARDLSTVLAEIETARAQVLSVDQQVGRVQAGAIDLPATSEVTKSVEDLERTVTEEMADLGARIERLAERAVTSAPVDEDPIVRRLRSLATSARQLGMGISEDLKSRRAKPSGRGRKR